MEVMCEELSRQEWLNERKKGIGGSDSPVILGVSPFCTRFELWQEKLGYIEDTEPTPAMKRGTALEPLIADMYAESTGRMLEIANRSFRHPVHNWMVGNVDRLIINSNNGHSGPGVLEIKCPGLSIFSKCKREGLQDYYIIQLQHYLEVMGFEWGSFAIFNAERWELVWFDVKRDDELISIIVAEGEKFWKLVESGTPPEMNEPAIDLPNIEPSEVITMDSTAWKKAVDKLREAQEIRKEAEEYESEAKAEIQRLMIEGDADVAEGCGARVYWRWSEGRKTFDKKALAKDFPSIDLEAYEKTGKPYRAFRTYFLGGGNKHE